MANLKELATQLRGMRTKNNPADMQQKVDLCFEMMGLYTRIAKKRRTVKDEKNCCYAAVILSGIAQKDLAPRVKDFLEEYELPKRAEQVLRANITHMTSL